ncbi:MAG TPA: hypothetical protein VFB76_06115 [Candidatus Angelobacter sp.]|nr:hypothetical protein [Candidatus Angelobacter sp.]
MPARKKQITKQQIIRAIQTVARKLGRVPIQAEFVRISGVEAAAVRRHFGQFFRAAHAAGLKQAWGKVDSADILQDWAEVVRRLGHIPTYREYGEEGRYSTNIAQKRFSSLVQDSGGISQLRGVWWAQARLGGGNGDSPPEHD